MNRGMSTRNKIQFTQKISRSATKKYPKPPGVKIQFTQKISRSATKVL